jgi:UDP:flavonoid glycosyltransferase YjiC (YdhE family)
MRILISTTRGAGHFGPLIPFAKAFLRNNDQVLVAAAASVAPMVERAGLDLWPYADPPDELRDPIFAEVRGMTDEEAALRVVGDVFVRIDARNALPGLQAAIDSWRPDVVIYESTEYAAALAAEKSGVPAVRVSVFLIGEELVMDAAAEALDELRAELDLPADPDAERLRSAMCFSLAPAALEHAAPDNVQRFRETAATPRLLPAWWRNRDWPLVYLTFGSVAPTMDFFPDLYRAAIDALAVLPVRVLVTIGHDRSPSDLGPLPPNVRVVRWLPQADVLPHAAAVVCHGGSGTMLGALAAGVPTAVVPLFADQPYNARRVEELGAGIAVEDPADLTGAVQRLLEEPGHRAAALAIADEISELPPVDAAVEIVEELAAYNQPRSVAWSTA